MKTIKSKREFEEVFAGGKRANHRLVRICVKECDEGGSGKVAFVAAKRLGNAVWRNRSKRVLRAAAREYGLPQDGRKIILFATRNTHDAHSHDVALAIGTALSRVR